MNNIDVLEIQKAVEANGEKSRLATEKVKAGLRAEIAREKLDPEEIIDKLNTLYDAAGSIDVSELPRLQFKANILFGVLRKCMPDLRSLEVKEKTSNASTLIIEMRDKS